MSSDPQPLDRLAAALVKELTASLPGGWKVRAAEAKAVTSLGIVLYWEQGDLVTTINGAPVPPGHVGVEYTLTLAAPEQDPEKGTTTVTNAVVSLLPALDAMSNLYWDRAEKVRLDTGETTYRLAVVNLSSYHTTTEPDAEPDTMPEEA